MSEPGSGATQPRAVVAFPGRGAYGAASLGIFQAPNPRVDEADALRVELGLDSLRSLDAATAFDPGVHLRPANAGPLAWLASVLDAERAAADHRVVAMVGNSLGWYAALTASGALGFADGFRLVQGIAVLQEEAVERGNRGGHVIYPRLDGDWRPNPAWNAAIAAAREGNGQAFPSIDLGGYVILTGTEAAIDHLVATLPEVEIGGRHYPLRLAFHVPYHSPLQAEVADAAAARFAGLGWQAPRTTLIDGRGQRFTPWDTDPAEVAAYTLGEQLTGPYDFAAAVRVALREYAPDVVVLPGPGNSLGGVIGQLVVSEGYRGIRTRRDFESAQAGRAPLVLAMSR